MYWPDGKMVSTRISYRLLIALFRFYSASVLGFLHRKIAIQELFKLGQGEDIPLERALGGLDMFVLQDRDGDLDDVGSHVAGC